MLYIPNDSNDPRFNLAFEEYVLKNLDMDDPYLLLWRNAPTVVVGRFQNTPDEINADYVEEHGVHVVRRMTGGGAVYHDLGNLNFSFIERKTSEGIDMKLFARRIAQALQGVGLDVEVSGRNDLTIDGRKFSGNAQYIYHDRVLHHGTILYSSDLDNVQAALNVKADKIASKGVKSVKSRVTNLIDYMPVPLSIEEFQKSLLLQLFQGAPVRTRVLTEAELEEINELVSAKYAKWEWNFGRSPAYNVSNRGRFGCGEVAVYLWVDEGIIRSCRIHGDFFTARDIHDLESGLTGIECSKETLSKAYQDLNVANYLEGLGLDEFLKLTTGTKAV
ncbi:MAG: lipoate--protein ligase [Bacillota bacterium]|jgi:lipoate-protein ligase A